MLIVFVICMGLMVGSFLNVCIHRLPRNESIVWPRSHCPGCNKLIRWHDNIPIISFILLKGKCRDCHQTIRLRYPAVEVLTAALSCAAYLRWGPTPYGIMAWVAMCAFVVVSFIDWEHQIIPDEISLGGIVVGIIFSTLFPAWHQTASHLWGFLFALLGVLLGGGFLYLAGVIGEWIFKKEAMGGGDVKLLAAIGAIWGWKSIGITIFVASAAGAFIGLLLRLTKGHERIPFGPFLVLGAIVYMFAGDKIFLWYVENMLKY